jgi:hypothetical protein
MRLLPVVLLFVGASLNAQVKFDPDSGAVTIDGKPFTIFNRGGTANKPFLAPVRSASGKIITRGFPMETIPGESRDHLHHRGLWFSYDDVNGVKFWENDPSYTKGVMGRQVVRNIHWGSGTLTATINWQDFKGNVLLEETREMEFTGDANVRWIHFRITLAAAVDVTLGDTKEGAFAIRLVEPFTERKGAKIVNAEGSTGMVNVWGKRSPWVDYTGELDGERLGIAILDHPSNPRHPTYWHARDYGLFALNPFGRKAFDEDQPESQWKIPKGDKLLFRWSVLIHPGDAAGGHVADLYKDFASKK